MNVELSVIIPAHNPRMDYLQRVLDALRAQTLPMAQWGLIVVDNGSTSPLAGRLDLTWHPHAAVVREEKLGLTFARLRGFAESNAQVLILVDDDNVLAPEFLAITLVLANDHPFLGTWGGCIEPEYEQPEVALPQELHPLLTLRAADKDLWSNDPDHHSSTPWGAGLCVRRVVAEGYRRELEQNPDRTSLDLQGGKLLYGGDTDITYTGCRLGFAKGVFPSLRVKHLISANRCTPTYLCQVSEGRGYSEVLHGYVLSGVVPQPERLSLNLVVRRLKLLLKPGLERSVALAHLRGRRQAFRDLSGDGKTK